MVSVLTCCEIGSTNEWQSWPASCLGPSAAKSGRIQCQTIAHSMAETGETTDWPSRQALIAVPGPGCLGNYLPGGCLLACLLAAVGDAPKGIDNLLSSDWLASRVSLTRQLQRLECMWHSQIWRGQIQKDCIGHTIELAGETQVAHISVVDCYKVTEAVSLKFIARLIRTRLVEIECVQAACGFKCAQEIVWQGAGTGARFYNYCTGTHLQLMQNHAYVRCVDDLSAMRQCLCPQFRIWLQDIRPAFG